MTRLSLRSSPSYEAIRRKVEATLSGDARLGALPQAASYDSLSQAASYGAGALCVDVAGAEERRDVLARALHAVRGGGLHLPVLVDDAGTSIGPLTTPGYSACLECAGDDINRAASLPEPAVVPPRASVAPAPLVVALVAATAALEVGRIVSDADRLPLSLDHVIRVRHDTGAVGILGVGQVDGCEVCGSLIELRLRGEL
ncbi:hypothetical protein ACF1HA_13060 [Streptomyces gardneri]|uniref:hypothetical protein n=1 Tax=Streptomyces gardneri TaxID=66892 RepID=UPI0037022671